MNFSTAFMEKKIATNNFFDYKDVKREECMMGKCQIYISYISTLSHSNFRLILKQQSQQQQPNYGQRKLGIIH